MLKRKAGFFVVLVMVFVMVFIACDPGNGNEDEDDFNTYHAMTYSVFNNSPARFNDEFGTSFGNTVNQLYFFPGTSYSINSFSDLQTAKAAISDHIANVEEISGATVSQVQNLFTAEGVDKYNYT